MREREQRPVLWGSALGVLLIILSGCTADVVPPRRMLESPRSDLIPATATASPPPSRSPVTTPAPQAETLRAPDGSFAVRLPRARWRKYEGPDRTALYLERYGLYRGMAQVAIRIGSPDGRVKPCDEPESSWGGAPKEKCEAVVAKSLQQLVDATFLWGFGSRVTLIDGERAVVGGMRSYEYPAHGSQSLVYVVAMHGTRPVVARFWSGSESGLHGVEEVLAGFRFRD